MVDGELDPEPSSPLKIGYPLAAALDQEVVNRPREAAVIHSWRVGRRVRSKAAGGGYDDLTSQCRLLLPRSTRPEGPFSACNALRTT